MLAHWGLPSVTILNGLKLTSWRKRDYKEKGPDVHDISSEAPDMSMRSSNTIQHQLSSAQIRRTA